MRIWLAHEAPTAGGGIEWRWRLMVGCGFALALGLTLAATGHGLAAAVSLAAASVAGGVFPARRALAAVRARSLDINVLMVLAVLGALAIGEWLEAASVVFLFAVAQWLEARTLERARQAIHELMDLAPRQALVRRDGVERIVPVEALQVGDHMIVRPGDKVPLDGVVETGQSDVNEAPLTGESLPVDKAPGDEVFAGTINGRGALVVRVTRLVQDTRVAKVTHLVETAQASRAPVQSFVDRFARVYTPAVLVVALIVGLVPPVFGVGDPAAWFYRALVLLVISCPCALVISTPVSIVSALSAAARNGVLVKGGAHLERLASVRVVALDKTGTLTRGDIRVAEVFATGSTSAHDVLRFAAAVEARSTHPIGRAILSHAQASGVAVVAAEQVSVLAGLGVEGDFEGRHVVAGNEPLLASRGIPPPRNLDGLEQLRTGQRLVVLVAVDGASVGGVLLEDQPRATAREAVGLLREHGIRKVVMLTGDREHVAARVAGELGLDGYYAGLLPDQKHARIRDLRTQHGPVLMVGDGVNDAPALAAADVGVAMGAAGSDVAIETADVALMSDELLRLPYAVRLARATLRNVRVNVAISLALKSVFLVMAVAGAATLWMAVLADAGATVIVVGNAMRLLRAR
jgi:Cd2+/Zn2+-exporting ATPase